jgi:hypothetical protein
MIERIWDRFLTEYDKAVFAAGEFGLRGGFGKRLFAQCLYLNHCVPHAQMNEVWCRQITYSYLAR